MKIMPSTYLNLSFTLPFVSDKSIVNCLRIDVILCDLLCASDYPINHCLLCSSNIIYPKIEPKKSCLISLNGVEHECQTPTTPKKEYNVIRMNTMNFCLLNENYFQ